MGFDEAIRLKAIRSFHVGGGIETLAGIPPQPMSRVPGEASVLIDMNGDHAVGQMYVQHFELEAPRHPYPVLLWHGGGLTGACWESTPSGKAGWLDYFLRAGYSVYVSDAFERGRASWPPYPEVLPHRPDHRPLDAIWHFFRFGPAESYRGCAGGSVPYAGQQFPVAHLANFARQMVPRWAGTESRVMAAYDALIERIGSCLVIGHSQGAYFALSAARRRPDLVRAVVAIEPAAMPAVDASPPKADALPPHLWVWGDYLSLQETWRRYTAKSVDYVAQLRAGGVRADVLDLPAEGIKGNSHMLIMDENNACIAARVDAWLQSACRQDG